MTTKKFEDLILKSTGKTIKESRKDRLHSSNSPSLWQTIKWWWNCEESPTIGCCCPHCCHYCRLGWIKDDED